MPLTESQIVSLEKGQRWPQGEGIKLGDWASKWVQGAWPHVTIYLG